MRTAHTIFSVFIIITPYVADDFCRLNGLNNAFINGLFSVLDELPAPNKFTRFMNLLGQTTFVCDLLRYVNVQKWPGLEAR